MVLGEEEEHLAIKMGFRVPFEKSRKWRKHIGSMDRLAIWTQNTWNEYLCHNFRVTPGSGAQEMSR
jgi:hypothetical protein